MNPSDNVNELLRSHVRTAAHDVRTPLTSIFGFTELLLDDRSLSPDSRENAETILRETKRLWEMLEALFEEIGAIAGPEAPERDEN